MWKQTRVLPRRTRLIVGCGSNHEHPGNHWGCDTLDIDPRMDPDILGNIIDEELPGARYFKKYQYIMCEGLYGLLYDRFQLYENLSFIRAERSTIVLWGLEASSLRAARHNCECRGWKVTKIESGAGLPAAFSPDPDIVMKFALMLRFSPHPGLVIR